MVFSRREMELNLDPYSWIPDLDRQEYLDALMERLKAAPGNVLVVEYGECVHILDDNGDIITMTMDLHQNKNFTYWTPQEVRAEMRSRQGRA
jgi:hypothetical protein